MISIGCKEPRNRTYDRSMNVRFGLVVVAAVLVGGVSCTGGDKDDGGNVPRIAGVASIVHGPSLPASFNVGAPSFAAPTDGQWYVSPDQVRVRVDRVNFAGHAGAPGDGADLVDCVLTFDRTTPSLSNLLDCPFEIAPGTYGGMTVFVNGEFEILVSDATNGIHTDPASATGLSATAPAGGAAFVPYSRPLGATGVEQQFPAPLVVGSGDTISLSVVMDAVQTVILDVSGGGTVLAFNGSSWSPVNLFPTLGAPGVARYFTTAGTADSYNDSVVLANILRVYYAAGSNGQPVYSLNQQVANTINTCAANAFTKAAHPADPATTVPNDAGAKIGGWLGRDPAGTTCWALPADPAYSAYEAYLTLSNVTVVGSSGVLSCVNTATPAPPTSGPTYASGCPAITADATATLTLVAD